MILLDAFSLCFPLECILMVIAIFAWTVPLSGINQNSRSAVWRGNLFLWRHIVASDTLTGRAPVSLMLSQPAAALYTVWDQHYREWLGQWLWFKFDWINQWCAYVSSDCYWFKPKFHLPSIYSALWDLLVSLAAHCTVSKRINIRTI